MAKGMKMLQRRNVALDFLKRFTFIFLLESVRVYIASLSTRETKIYATSLRVRFFNCVLFQIRALKFSC